MEKRAQKTRRSALKLALLGALAVGCWAASSAPSAALDDLANDPRTPRRLRTASLSSGLPWDGRLERAVRLNATDTLRPISRAAKGGNLYGTSELVSLLERTARAVAARWPGSQLNVGDLSGPRGGKLRGHHSHRSGRDVDVAFFMRDAQGRSSQSHRFVTFGIEGSARRTQDTLYFDDARNWAFVSALLRDANSRVQYIFVAEALRTRLLMEGRRQGASDAFLRTAAAVLVQPQEGEKHDTHFHVRIYCPRDDRPTCVDNAPYWPWYDGPAPDGKYEELPIVRWKTPHVAVPRPLDRAQRGASGG